MSLPAHQVKLLEAQTLFSEVFRERCAQEEGRNLVELLSGIDISELIGVHAATNIVAIGDCQLEIGGVEAIRNKREHVAILDSLQVSEIIRVSSNVFFNQAKIAALYEDVVRLSRSNRFKVDIEAAAIMPSIGDIGDIADGEWSEPGLGARESMPTTVADTSSIGSLLLYISGAILQVLSVSCIYLISSSPRSSLPKTLPRSVMLS